MQGLLSEVRKSARYFEAHNYPKTSRLILSLAEKIDEHNGRLEYDTLSQELVLLPNTFKEEYELIIPFGQDYRKRCFEETWLIVISAMNVAENKQEELLAETNSFMKQMHQVKRDMAPSAGLMMKLYGKTKRSEQEGLLMFRLTCDEYEQAMEGVFNHLAKTLCVFIKILSTNNPDYKEINKANTYRIRDALKQIFGVSPVFLENWDEQKAIRNAIAHSQAKFFPKENKARFFTLDGYDKTKILYDKTMTFEDFFNIYMQLVDAIDSFYYAIELVRVMTLLVTAHSHRDAT